MPARWTAIARSSSGLALARDLPDGPTVAAMEAVCAMEKNGRIAEVTRA
jgi:hypothetical protein